MTNFQEAIHIHYQKKKHRLLHEPARNADSASSDDDLSRLKNKDTRTYSRRLPGLKPHLRQIKNVHTSKSTIKKSPHIPFHSK